MERATVQAGIIVRVAYTRVHADAVLCAEEKHIRKVKIAIPIANSLKSRSATRRQHYIVDHPPAEIAFV